MAAKHRGKASATRGKTTTGARHRALKRRPVPYAWLGAGAITLGVGAALASGAGVAHADSGESTDSSSSSPGASPASSNSSNDDPSSGTTPSTTSGSTKTESTAPTKSANSTATPHSSRHSRISADPTTSTSRVAIVGTHKLANTHSLDPAETNLDPAETMRQQVELPAASVVISTDSANATGSASATEPTTPGASPSSASALASRSTKRVVTTTIKAAALPALASAAQAPTVNTAVTLLAAAAVPLLNTSTTRTAAAANANSAESGIASLGVAVLKIVDTAVSSIEAVTRAALTNPRIFDAVTAVRSWATNEAANTLRSFYTTEQQLTGVALTLEKFGFATSALGLGLGVYEFKQATTALQQFGAEVSTAAGFVGLVGFGDAAFLISSFGAGLSAGDVVVGWLGALLLPNSISVETNGYTLNGPPDPITGKVTGTAKFTNPDHFSLEYGPATIKSQGGGTVTVDANTGDFTYTPLPSQRQAAEAKGQNGSDTFRITASDGIIQSASQLITVPVDAGTPQPGNPPYKENDPDVDGVVTGTAMFTDPAGGHLKYSVTTNPTQGSITHFDSGTGAFTYTPRPDSTATTDTFTVTATNGVHTANETITVPVSPANPIIGTWTGPVASGGDSMAYAGGGVYTIAHLTGDVWGTFTQTGPGAYAGHATIVDFESFTMLLNSDGTELTVTETVMLNGQVLSASAILTKVQSSPLAQ
jgi:VCBS repeat-containing protein